LTEIILELLPMTNDFIIDQLLNLVTSLIWIILGIGVTYLGRYSFIVIPAKRLWGFLFSDKIIICTATTKSDTGEYLRPSTGIGQVRALAVIITSLNKAYRKVNFKRILLSEDEIKHNIEDDLLYWGDQKIIKLQNFFLKNLISTTYLSKQLMEAFIGKKLILFTKVKQRTIK